jgi:hypothetical protein
MDDAQSEAFLSSLYQSSRCAKHSEWQSESAYQYKPLKEHDTIRLLHVRIRQNSAFPTPKFALLHTTIQTAPPYETFFYVWQTSLRNYSVQLRTGDILQVTNYLKEALPYIARHCETGFLWIDQICINQDDVLEKNGQVSAMRDIYSSCSSVIVWLLALSMQRRDSVDLER